MPGTTFESSRDWSGARVLVTGSSGFIGSHVVDRLTELRAEVHVVSRRPAPSGERAVGHRVDLTDADACSRLIEVVLPDVVLHLASAVTGSRDIGLVLPLMAANQAAAVHLLTAVVRHVPAARVVLAGSMEEPHQADGLIPSSPYAAAKAAATSYARMFWALYGTRVSVAQIAMVYGPGQRDLTKLIPYASLAMLRAEPLRLTSGGKLVDWVYVSDVVDALIRTAETDPAVGEVFDICSGHTVSVRQTVELLASIVSGGARDLQFGTLADRPLEHPQRADPRGARELLGWSSSVSLEDGLRNTVAWYAAHLAEDPGVHGQALRGVS